MTRREFIGGVLAFGMGGPTSVSAVDGTEPVPPKFVDGTEPVPPNPNLRFGVMSDIRITVTPRDCFGLAGKPMASTFVNVARDHGISGRARAC